MDNLKISYMDEKEVTQIIERMKILYGKDIRVSWGKKNDYLGMDLYFSILGKVRVTLVDYLIKVIEYIPEETMKTPPTPDGDHLFEVLPNKERNILDEEQATTSHHNVAQLLFATLRAIKDNHTSVSFLKMRM